MTGLAGLVAIVLIFVPIVGSSGGEPGFEGDPSVVLAFFQATGSAAAQLGRAVLVVGLLAFAWFAVGLSLLLADAEGRPAWRSTTAGASALLFVASGMNGHWQAAAYRADNLSAELATYAFNVGNLKFANGWVAMGSFALCAGWVIVRTRAQPLWLGWLAMVAGLGLVASRGIWTTSFWLAPYALFWLAMMVISIRLLRSISPKSGIRHHAPDLVLAGGRAAKILGRRSRRAPHRARWELPGRRTHCAATQSLLWRPGDGAIPG